MYNLAKSYGFYLSHFTIIFFINIYVANHYLADVFGEFQFYNTLFMFLLSISQMGTMQSFTVLAPQMKDDIKLIYASLMLRMVGYFLVALIVLVVFWIKDVSSVAYVYLLLFAPLTINMASILDYYNKTLVEVRYNFYYDGILFIVLVAVVTKLELSIAYIVLARFVSKGVSEYMKYLYVSKYIGMKSCTRKDIKILFGKSKAFVSNRVIVELYIRSEILILGVIATNKEIGLYAVAYSIYNAILIGEGLISRRLFPKLTKAFKNKEMVRKVLKDSIYYKSLYYLSAIAFVYFVLNEIVFTYLYDKEEYSESGVLLNLMLIGLLSHIFANNTNYLMMLKNKYLYFKRFGIGLVLNIVLGAMIYNMHGLEEYVLVMQFIKMIMVVFSVSLSYKYLYRSE